jgi:hypothetical protein
MYDRTEGAGNTVTENAFDKGKAQHVGYSARQVDALEDLQKSLKSV